MKNIFILLIFTLSMSGCNKSGEYVTPEKYANSFNIQYLFTQDGCKMYKLVEWNTIYFMTCPNSQTIYQSNCGKGCTKLIQQKTINRK